MQELVVIEKRADGSVKRRWVAPVAFVPMTRDEKSRREGSIIRCRVVISPPSVPHSET